MFTVVGALKHWRYLTQKTKHKMFMHTDHRIYIYMYYFGNKTIKSKTNKMIKKICML